MVTIILNSSSLKDVKPLPAHKTTGASVLFASSLDFTYLSYCSFCGYYHSNLSHTQRCQVTTSSKDKKQKGSLSSVCCFPEFHLLVIVFRAHLHHTVSIKKECWMQPLAHRSGSRRAHGERRVAHYYGNPRSQGNCLGRESR